MKSNDVLCLFVKAPFRGRVKTRLQPELNKEDALSLYRAMGQDVHKQLVASDRFDLVIFYWPEDGRHAIEAWLGDRHALILQNGKNLGDRMHDAFVWAQDQKYSKAIVLGTDTPSVTLSDIENAFLSLDQKNVVLGPSLDGGYYLIGLKEACAGVFRDIPWSSAGVLQHTIDRIEKMGMTVDLLDMKRDIDTYEDVRSLWKEQRSAHLSSGFKQAEETYAVLKALFSTKTLEDSDG